LKLDGWIPVRVYWREGEREPSLDWCLIGETRFIDPFFDTTLQRQMSHPFHQAFRRRTPITVLPEWAAERPGAPLAGIIFHMSRCGSTLVAQMLAALDQNIVLSEATPLDAVLRSHLRDPGIGEQERIQWLRGMVSALGRRRSEKEKRLFIKFDCWSIAELPLIALAFPDTPWIFLYRDPMQVLASHFRSPGGWTIPSILPPVVLGLGQGAAEFSWQEYRVRALARICELALLHCQTRRGLLINYSQLPDAVWSLLAGHFGVDFPEEDLNRLREAARYDAKTPGLTFEPRASNADPLPGEARDLATHWLNPLYRQLEALRAGTSAIH
jgi:hypothetical protein